MSQDLFVDNANCTIITGQTVSGAFKLNGEHLVNVTTPAAMTGATITFQTSQDNVTYSQLKDENGSVVTLQSGASTAIKVPPNLVYGWNWIKLVIPGTLGSNVTPVLGTRRYR